MKITPGRRWASFSLSSMGALRTNGRRFGQSNGMPLPEPGDLMGPHSAVGYSVLQRYREETGDRSPALLASTASPFKFNRAVLEALGRVTSVYG